MECLLPQIQLLRCIYITRRRQYSSFCSKFLTCYKLRRFPHPLSIFFFFFSLSTVLVTKMFLFFSKLFRKITKTMEFVCFYEKVFSGSFFLKLRRIELWIIWARIATFFPNVIQKKQMKCFLQKTQSYLQNRGGKVKKLLCKSQKIEVNKRPFLK